MKKLTSALLIAGFTAASSAAFAGDVSSGEGLYTSCASCHGAQAQGQGMFPPLNNLSEEEFITSMGYYKSGDQDALQALGRGLGEGNYGIMAPNAASLSQSDIEDLAAYVNSL